MSMPMLMWSPAAGVALGSFVAVAVAMVAVWPYVSGLPVQGPALPKALVMQPSTQASRVSRALSRLARPDDLEDSNALGLLLTQAGYRSRTAMMDFLALRVALTVGLPVVVLLFMGLADATAWTWVVALGAATLGYYAPSVVLRVRRRARQRRIGRAVPNMLDLLVSCVEAGLGVDMAMRHVCAEIVMASDELAAELQLVNSEMAAGIPRVEALKQLPLRTGVEDLASLVNVLGAVERYGAGIAQSIRAHAQLSRRRRAMEAEQRAAKASPALTVAMIVFILPPLFVVLLGPSVLAVTTWVVPRLAEGTL